MPDTVPALPPYWGPGRVPVREGALVTSTALRRIFKAANNVKMTLRPASGMVSEAVAISVKLIKPSAAPHVEPLQPRRPSS